MTLSRRDAIKLTLAGSALAAPARAAADHVKTIDIAFEGGGVKGAAFCGALEVLESRGFSYRHVIGTSAGAIAAALLAAGYTSREMQAILAEQDKSGKHIFKNFLLPPSIEHSGGAPTSKSGGLFERAKAGATALLHSSIDHLPGGARSIAAEIAQKAKSTEGEARTQWGRLLALLSTGAFASDAAFLAWLCDRIEQSPIVKAAGLKTAAEVRELTLGRFHGMTRAGGIQLSVVAADITGMRALVLNNHTAPDVPLVDAVRMSMGIPLVWPEVEWKKEWGKYRGIEMWDREGAGNRVVDGGVLSNFPLKYVIERRHMQPGGVLGQMARRVPTKILGLLLDESLSIPGVDPVKEKTHLAEKLPAFRSLSRVLHAMCGASDQDAIDESLRPQFAKLGLGADGPLCRIPVKGYETLDFDMDENRMKTLIKSGKTTMENYLQRPA
jgi:predicted acylesterase/phospholipase RssA